MSDPRTLLNPPSLAPAEGPMEALLNPVPGRLLLAEESAHEEDAEDDFLQVIDTRPDTRVHQAA